MVRSELSELDVIGAASGPTLPGRGQSAKCQGLLLAVVGVGAVFAAVVFVEEGLGDGLYSGVQLVDAELHACDGFEGDGVFEGFFGGAAPDEGGVAGDEDSGHFVGVEVGGVEAFDDDFAGVEFVVGRNFGGGELAGAG